MRKHKRLKHHVSTDSSLHVEIVEIPVSPPPSREEILEANEPYFVALAAKFGPNEAELARSKFLAEMPDMPADAEPPVRIAKLVRVTRPE